MGGLVEKALFKNKAEAVASDFVSLWQIGAKNIDGMMIDPLKPLVEGKKCVMVVNVATK